MITKSAVTHEEGCRHFGLDPNKKTLLVVGGSLGALSVNEAIKSALPQLFLSDLQILWQTGKPFYEEARQAVMGNEEKIVVREFIREMDQAYAAADIIVSRAGALAIAEICIVAKPVIFVPYPFAAEDHQTSNAQALVKVGAADMVPDNAAQSELLPKILSLASDPERQASMHKALKGLAITDADNRIAEKIFTLIPSQTPLPS